MVKDVTTAAVQALQAMAQAYNVPLDKAYYQIDNKQRGPIVSMWFITVTSNFDESKYYLKDINGVKLAIEKPAAEFLINAVVDYKAGLSHARHLYDQVPLSHDRPVWPKGFQFHHQNFSIDPVSSW